MLTIGSLVLALAMLAGPAVAAAPASTRHSGTVAMIDAQGGVMVVDEVGPWRVETGRTVVTPRTIVLTVETKVNTFIRVTVPDAYAGGFIEVPLEATDLSVGDFVTVESVRAGGRLVALTVTLAEVY